MYESFDHTADIGLRVRAPTLAELFADAARGLMAELVEDATAVPADREETVEIRAERLDDLLFDWLSELLYRFDSNRLVASRFHVEVKEGEVRARVLGSTFDPDLHRGITEIKAVTYHGLKVEQTEGGYLAEVILDI